MNEPQQRVDDLRQRLRALGYLDAGVDRFLLAPAGGARGPLGLAARASARVGLLGGMLLGPSAAIGIGARLPGLLNGVRDAFVVAVYFAVFFFLAITVTSFVITVAATLLTRRRPEHFAQRAARVSRAAGWVIAVASLAYLTLWWRNANAGFGWSAPAWTAFALVIAVAISLLLGHAQRITTLAVLAAAAGASAALPPVAARSWRVVLAGGVLAFLGASALLVSTAAVESPRGPDHPPLTVEASGGRSLRVIAIDGFDPVLYDAFEGDLSNRFVVRRGRLDAQDTSDPARAWITIATGVWPDAHGVHGIETRRVAGVQGSVAATGGAVARAVRAATDLVRLTRPAIASREERRAKTVWEIAEDAGLRTSVVNWWATWPAPPTGGIVITDRAPLRLEQGGALDAEIAPPALYETVRAAWPGIRERSRTAAAQLRSDDPEIAAVVKRSAELDASIVGLLNAVTEPNRDLDVIYLPGLDIAQHALLSRADDAAIAPSRVAARLDALRAYYRFLRTLLDPLLTPTERVSVFVVTQPGRANGSVGGVVATYQFPGVDVSPSRQSVGAIRVVDIAPTLLASLGLPLSRELAGKQAPLLFGFTRRYVDTYGRPFTAPASREGKPLDQEMIDRLRSLGYIK